MTHDSFVANRLVKLCCNTMLVHGYISNSLQCLGSVGDQCEPQNTQLNWHFWWFQYQDLEQFSVKPWLKYYKQCILKAYSTAADHCQSDYYALHKLDINCTLFVLCSVVYRPHYTKVLDMLLFTYMQLYMYTTKHIFT